MGPTLEPPATGERKAPVPEDSTVRTFSIFVGGPVYDFLFRAGLLRLGLPNILRRVAVLVGITWLPLLLLSLKSGLAFGDHVRIPFLYDASMYARFLLGLPLLIVAEVVIDPSVRRAVAEFEEGGLVTETEVPAFDNVLHGARRLRDSAIPEIALLVLAFFPVFIFQHEWEGSAISSWHTTARGLTPAGWWFAVFSAPMLRFITYRWLFRYFVWGALLWKVGHLHLTLTPTHPDHAAGLGFLALAQRRFGILFAALGCALAGRIGNSLIFEGRSVESFKFIIAGFIVLSLLVGLTPLMMLAPTLTKIRRAGLLEYGRLANRYTDLFDRKWVHTTEPVSEPLLGTGDIQSLADLGNSFALVDAMTIAPISKRLVIQLGFQAALPLLPVIILGTPTPELIHDLLKMIV